MQAGTPEVISSSALTGVDGLWRSLVAHLTGGQVVAGSNPVSPTVNAQVRVSVSPGLLHVRGSISVVPPLVPPPVLSPTVRRSRLQHMTATSSDLVVGSLCGCIAPRGAGYKERFKYSRGNLGREGNADALIDVRSVVAAVTGGGHCRDAS